MRPFTIAADGSLHMDSGSPSNSCQEKNRAPQSPGRRPCPELARGAGIWRFDAAKVEQTFSPRERYATGLRNSEALAVQPSDGALYAVVHGRDQLSDNWPKLYTVEQQTELPAEILVRITEGADFGWPSCYFDPMQGKQVLAPEYLGGDGGKAVGDCAMKGRPDVAFPAHWAPDALGFYTGTAFPSKYQGGAFVSFHGLVEPQTQAGRLSDRVRSLRRRQAERHVRGVRDRICRHGTARGSFTGSLQAHGSRRRFRRGDLRFR